MNVVVTGGAGFIGGNLCAALLGETWVDDVRVIDDLSTGRRDNVPEGVTLTEGSILDADLVTEALADTDAVVHLAARPSVPRSIADPEPSHRVNVTGTFNVLEGARHAARGPHVVVASSSSVYGANPALPKREDLATAPLSPYAASKLAAEAYSLAWAHSYGLDVLAFRFFNVFGPLQPAGHAYAAVVPAFVDAALDGRPLPVFGDGKQTRDFTFVGSVVAVLTDAVRRRVGNAGPVNLAFGTRVSLLELVEALEQELGASLEVEFRDPRPGDVRDSQADNGALRSLFPEVRPVTLADGLRATVEWFRRGAASG